LQSNRNTGKRRFSSEKGKGIAGTIIIHFILFALLILVTFSAPVPPEKEDGIMVNFGTGDTGFGMIEPSPPSGTGENPASAPPVQEKASAPAPSKVAVKNTEDPLLTQNKEEAPAINKVDPEAARKRLEKKEADKKLKDQLEAERIVKAQAEVERKRIEAEQQRESNIRNLTKNALANSKNAGTNSTSEGIAGGTGNQGDPNGSINSKNYGPGGGTGDKGYSYYLEGRKVLSIPLPKYELQQDGIVVVEVIVDRSGKVIKATPGKSGSSTLDENLLKVAKEAALKATFAVKPDAPEVQKGTITYNFKLK
jgi:colicin import membrane protein